MSMQKQDSVPRGQRTDQYKLKIQDVSKHKYKMLRHSKRHGILEFESNRVETLESKFLMKFSGKQTVNFNRSVHRSK